MGSKCWLAPQTCEKTVDAFLQMTPLWHKCWCATLNAKVVVSFIICLTKTLSNCMTKLEWRWMGISTFRFMQEYHSVYILHLYIFKILSHPCPYPLLAALVSLGPVPGWSTSCWLRWMVWRLGSRSSSWELLIDQVSYPPPPLGHWWSRCPPPPPPHTHTHNTQTQKQNSFSSLWGILQITSLLM